MLPFAKMNGAGNEILVVDERGLKDRVTAEAARRIGEGRLAFDQMMVLGDATAPGVDAVVRIYNIDGTRAGACGNGTRCVAWYMLQGTGQDRLRLDIDGQEVLCRRDAATTFTVDMGPPRLEWQAIPLARAADTLAVPLGADLARFGLAAPAAVSMGNPHAVFFVPDAHAIELARVGAHFEHHPMFPDRANISFAEVEAPDRIRLYVWERGAGATRACGSAACATLVAGARLGRTDRRARLMLPGGDLTIEWRTDDHVLMTGPVELEEQGDLVAGRVRRGVRPAHRPVETLTFGCRLNIVESDAMRVAAEAAGERDLVIVNTCAVTAEAARQAGQAIRRTRRERPDARIVVTGCAAEIEPDRFRSLPGVERLIGNAQKAAPETWGPTRDLQGPDGAATGGSGAATRDLGAAHTRGFVEIQNGCDHACTFCVIPQGRGASRSVPPEDLVATLRRNLDAGARDIVLTGVDITSYEAGGLRLGALVKHLLRALPGLERLRLSSIDCIEADADLLDVVASEPRFMPHLHLSLQSGADLILKRMKRRHSRDEAIRFCADLRRLRPDMVFGADVIVGFPTETEAQFEETCSLVEACGIAHLHVFPYSARPGTPAARMPAVNGEVVKARAERLRADGRAALVRHLDRQVGRRLRVLSERGGRARAEDFTAVRVGDVEPNRMLDVEIAGHDGRELQVRVASAIQYGR